jgi:hypothetical protein
MDEVEKGEKGKKGRGRNLGSAEEQEKELHRNVVLH